MKVKVEVDCTPEEARAFLGLPDVQPMQDALMKELQDRMSANMRAMDPETMIRTWLPASIQGADQLHKMFWSQMQQAFTGVANATGTMTGPGENRSKSGNENKGGAR